VLFLKLLRQVDGPFRLELSMPEAAIEADPAGNDVDVIKKDIMVPDHDVLMIGKTHPLHEVGNDLAPLVGVKVFALRQGQAGVPDRTRNTRTSFPRQPELSGKSPSIGAGHVATDDFAGVPAALAEVIIQRTTESASALNFRLHRAPPCRSGGGAPHRAAPERP
jgi:hypothetical protein